MLRSYIAQVTFLCLTAALLLAASQAMRPEGWTLASLYGYWLIRVLIEATLFIAFFEVIDRVPGLKSRVWPVAVTAAVVSLFPFALSITALDLILGLPELDGLTASALPTAPSTATTANGISHIGSFFLEVIYLSDNHLALCLLLTAPKLFVFSTNTQTGTKALTEAQKDTADVTDSTENPDLQDTSLVADGTGFGRHLETPLEGDLLRVEAQEHYVRLVSETDSRMVLYRFNDIVAELPGNDGMQVHRSHWVAYAAVVGQSRENGRLWLDLKDGSKVPVSRKYMDDVDARFGKETTAQKKAVN
ncbi:LytTR family DNA-binding domain-containing protein [uncultured Roseibium sp.]|uniref:LytTR family DNA-binding domain-containing protein n=1 Tax=uncultured Roseibium sp. TaxID=1936171 RepID=UPI002625FB98|nr:LytTR family DNA-binding domain-containing protein [uncultured Roseibium sp.]